MVELRWRFERVAEAGLDALVCCLPQHILMLTGYRPRLGSGLALARADGSVWLCVPSDEVELAREAGVTEVLGFQPVTLEQWRPLAEALATGLGRLASALPRGARVGFEDEPLMTPNAYVSTLQLGGALGAVLRAGLPDARLQPASALLRELRSRLTDSELSDVRAACALGERAFDAARSAMAPGRAEYEVAAAANPALLWGEESGVGSGGSVASIFDQGGDVWVMSGPNSALAYRAFAMTGTRRLEPGDLVLVHMNPQVRGLWSDLTRTFVLGEPDAGRRSMLEAVLRARAAAREPIRPGADARRVDAAARDSLGRSGFGAAFKHQTGHGVGFNGISGLDAPSLHPLSDDVLAPGMCFNVEPSVYLDGLGGCRHCDVIALGEDGPEELSPYLSSYAELVVPC